MHRTRVDVQVTHGAPWLPGELLLACDGSPLVTITGEIDALAPDEVFCIRAGNGTDMSLLDAAKEVGFNVLEE